VNYFNKNDAGRGPEQPKAPVDGAHISPVNGDATQPVDGNKKTADEYEASPAAEIKKGNAPNHHKERREKPRAKKRATPAQKNLLLRLGFVCSTPIAELTLDQASKIIKRKLGGKKKPWRFSRINKRRGRYYR
jgi:hypothetical protein